jgi:thioredoxin-dependent peroxiredoxin
MHGKWKVVFVAAAILVALTGGIMALDRSGLLSEGDIAPDFTARLSSGEEITLSQYRGKKNVVLSFYPADFTAGCTSQACSYRDRYQQVVGLDAVILGVSTDGMTKHQEFSQAYQLPFPLVSDPERAIIRLYGAARFGGGLLPTKRVSYVIDKEGVIRLVTHHEFAVQRHIEDILRVLAQLEIPVKQT